MLRNIILKLLHNLWLLQIVEPLPIFTVERMIVRKKDCDQLISLLLTAALINVTVKLFSVFKPFPLSLADVKQEMLETIVPKSEHDFIMVVLGEHRGQVST